MLYSLNNSFISISVDSKGAELKSVQKLGREYMWQGDPTFWGRTSPVLFPLVGSLKDKSFVSGGVTYTMGQHGFARDTEFELVDKTEDSIVFELVSSTETLAKWPYEFRLRIAYTIKDSSVRVNWQVFNETSKELFFSIGAHPGFNCPQSGHSYHLYEAELEVDGSGTSASESGEAAKSGRLIPVTRAPYYLIEQNSNVGRTKYSLELTDGILPINQELFAKDALIFYDTDIRRVSLADENGREYVMVDFDAPLVGLWSPVNKNAPFVCIEPWYGMADFVDADGIWEHRAYGNRLLPGQSFDEGYTITVT